MLKAANHAMEMLKLVVGMGNQVMIGAANGKMRKEAIQTPKRTEMIILMNLVLRGLGRVVML